MEQKPYSSGILANAFIFLFFIFYSGCGSSSEPAPSSSLIANAGNDVNILKGESVTLNGNGSFDQEGGAFDFSWSLISKPAKSTANLSAQDQPTPSFTVDESGKYKVMLTISNGQSSSMDTVTVAAFSVIDLSGTYNNLFPGPNVGIRKFGVYNNRLCATCEFTVIGGIDANRIATFDGQNWEALGSGLEEGSIFDKEVYQNEMYVTGQFEMIGGIQAKNIARWDGANWKPVGSGIGNGTEEAGFALEVYEGELYVGGRFTRAGDVTVSNMAKWDGNQWVEVGSLAEGSVRVLKIYNDRLYAGGFFTNVTGTDAEYLACYDGSQWTGLGATQNLEQGSTGAVRHMAIFQDELYISGDFQLNGSDVSELIVWDGSQFRDFGRAFSFFGGNEIKALAVFKDALYIGGSFNQVVATQASNILRWDGENWGVMAAGIGGTVLTIQGFQDQLYVGGDFLEAGNQTAENITIWESP